MARPEPSQFTLVAPRIKNSPSVRAPMLRSVFFLLIGINVLWGGSTLAAKIALASIPPMTLAFIRFSVAALLMYGVALAIKVDLRVSRRDWLAFWAMGVVGLALTYLLTYAGIQQTTATNASLLIATQPVFLALLAYFLLRERMPGSKIGGIVAGLVGVYFIVANGWWPRHVSGAVTGDLLIAFGLVFEAGSTILGKGLVSRYPTITVMTYQMATGAIALAPFAVYELMRAAASGHHLTWPPLPAALALLYLIVPCTVFAYTVWFMILDKQEASEMSVFLFVQPVVGALLGIIHGDPVSSFIGGGALLVLVGLALINRRPSLPTAPPTA